MIRLREFALVVTAAVLLGTCGDDGEGNLDNAGQACDSPDQCYEEIDPADLQGEVECLDRVPSGYCTHTCSSDADCCAVEGECDDGFPQVCAPFENSTKMRCFLTCERTAIGDEDPSVYCQEHAHPDFNCRSTGGGAKNRQVCVP